MSRYVETTRRLFDESLDLSSDERKSYYQELVSFTRGRLLNLPDDYGVYLKSLFFQGILPEEYEKGLRHWEPFLICLSAPFIDRDYVLSIFNQYRPLCAFEAVDLYRIHFDGEVSFECTKVIARYKDVVRFLADKRANWLVSPYADFRFLYLRLYGRVFYELLSGNSAAQTIGVEVIDYVESEFEVIKDLPESQEFLVSLRKRLMGLLAGEADNPELVYSDPVLLEFLNRYSNKQLPPSLQLMVEEIYSGLSRHIDFVNGEIKY